MATLNVKFRAGDSPQFTVTTPGGTDAKNFTVNTTQDITWQLNQSQSDPISVKFHETDGIKFTSTWPQSPPAGNDTQWTVHDVVSSATLGTFAYDITLDIGNIVIFHDPDLTNTPPP